jgi:alternate signal-mediated exported protein
MNKLTSGAIVGTLGIALLLGGAGTFAMWNSTATTEAGTVAAGTLSIANAGTPTWKNVSSDAAAGGVAIPSISAYKIVPGDTLQMTQTFTVAATGNNLAATLSYDAATIVAAGTNTTASAALKAATTVTMNATGTGVAAGTTANTMTVVLPSTVSGTTAQNGALDFSKVAFNLVQNTRA